jgi:hypothetical protein
MGILYKIKKITSNGVHPNILWQHYLITIVQTKIYMKLDYSFKISIQIHLKFVVLCSETKHSSTVSAYLVNQFPLNNP